MLVLSRKQFEAIVIGGNIKVWVVEIRKDTVRLGIEAPIDVPVHRQEVQDAIEAGIAKGEAMRIKTTSVIPNQSLPFEQRENQRDKQQVQESQQEPQPQATKQITDADATTADAMDAVEPLRMDATGTNEA